MRRLVQDALSAADLSFERVTTTTTFPVMKDAILQGMRIVPQPVIVAEGCLRIFAFYA